MRMVGCRAREWYQLLEMEARKQMVPDKGISFQKLLYLCCQHNLRWGTGNLVYDESVTRSPGPHLVPSPSLYAAWEPSQG